MLTVLIVGPTSAVVRECQHVEFVHARPDARQRLEAPSPCVMINHEPCWDRVTVYTALGAQVADFALPERTRELEDAILEYEREWHELRSKKRGWF